MGQWRRFRKRNAIKSEKDFRNFFYQKILEEFEFVKKVCFSMLQT